MNLQMMVNAMQHTARSYVLQSTHDVCTPVYSEQGGILHTDVAIMLTVSFSFATCSSPSLDVASTNKKVPMVREKAHGTLPTPVSLV